MEKVVHRAKDRGFADHGWLKSAHSFSFANYYDPEKMGFGKLRVLNDDYVAPDSGFPAHPHQNMEIVSIVHDGQLAHKDSEGNGEIIHENDVQIMSAGTGIEHSEYNPSKDEHVKFFQIWVFPEKKDIEPRYEQKHFSPEHRHNNLVTVVSPNKSDSALWINQDAWFSMADMDKGHQLNYTLQQDSNGVYLIVIDGAVEVDKEHLYQKDAIGVYNTGSFSILPLENSRLLLIEVPME